MAIKNSISRRDFISTTALGTAGILGLSLVPEVSVMANSKEDKSKVVIIKNDNASVGNETSNKYPVNQEVVQKMVDLGIQELTGIQNIGDAWKSLFPELTKNSIISIKINCIARGGGPYVGINSTGLVSHPEVAYSIANSLTQMMVDGSSYSPDNIIIWDRADIEVKNSGYVINRDKPGVKCYGTAGWVGSGGKTGCGKTGYAVNGSTQYFSEIYEKSHYVINLPVLKNHSFGGFTLSLKNNYGVIHMPECDQLHDCYKGIAQLNALVPIKQKQKLIILDAVYAVRSGGASGYPEFKLNKLLFAKDPVAIDIIGANLLKENKMSENSYKTGTNYLKLCASDDYKLGNFDLNKIETVNIDTTYPASIEDEFKQDNHYQFINYPNPFRKSTHISFQLDENAMVSLTIFNLHGQLINRLFDKHLGSGLHHITWDGIDHMGNAVSKGIYIARLDVNNHTKTLKLNLIE